MPGSSQLCDTVGEGKRRRGLLVFFVLLILGPSCGEDQLVGPRVGSIDLAGKPGTSSDPTVSDTDPSSAPQDTTLDVHVFGLGFDRGSNAELALDCETGCLITEKVKTNSTRFVSQNELVANITIATDADTTSYDVLVTTSKGKRGVGIELFEITLGHPNPKTGYTKFVVEKLSGASTCYGEGINDRLDVIGYCSFRKSSRRAFIWNPVGTLLDLGPGQALKVSNSGGPVVVGFTGDSDNPQPAIWEMGSGSGPLTPPQLPECNKGIVNGVDELGERAVGINCGVPVVWERETSSWSAPVELPLPPLRTGGAALDISPNGVIMGILWPYLDGTGGEYFVWLPPYLAAERVPPAGYTYILVNGVNDLGDVAGTVTSEEYPGWRSLLWKRNAGGWDDPIIIDHGYAQDVNNWRTVVGKSVNDAYVWTAAAGIVELGLVNTVKGTNEAGDVVGRLKDNAIVWFAPR